jgi:hypothetical protein
MSPQCSFGSTTFVRACISCPLLKDRISQTLKKVFRSDCNNRISLASWINYESTLSPSLSEIRLARQFHKTIPGARTKCIEGPRPTRRRAGQSRCEEPLTSREASSFSRLGMNAVPLQGAEASVPTGPDPLPTGRGRRSTVLRGRLTINSLRRPLEPLGGGLRQRGDVSGLRCHSRCQLTSLGRGHRALDRQGQSPALHGRGEAGAAWRAGRHPAGLCQPAEPDRCAAHGPEAHHRRLRHRLPRRNVAKYSFERIAKLPVEIDISSEFRYREGPLPEGGAALFVSQSGETLDTLAALACARSCKQHGC